MRLARYIRSHLPLIVEEWVDFARTLRPFDSGTDRATLKDAVVAMLRVIANDVETPETPLQQIERSRGRVDAGAETPSPAWEHGLERLESGLDINQVVAEFRALRAVVFRLYRRHEVNADPRLDEFVRFNESVDQAIAETLAAYTTQLDKLRNTLLAVLAHDLRGPLQAILITGETMRHMQRDNPRVALQVERITRGAARMHELIEDFLMFVTPTIGGEIPIQREEMDMVAVCREIVFEVSATLRTGRIHLQSAGPTTGRWDRARVEQILSNLLRNAAEHGAEDRCITVMVNGKDDGVHVSVHNFGAPIPEHALSAIFKPLVRLGLQQQQGQHEHLGLGLFIAKELVERHGGRIGVASSAEAGTTFHFFLPHAS